MGVLQSAWSSPWVRGLFLVGLYAVLAASFGSRVAEADSSPWLVAVAVASGTAVLFGPAAWAVRARVPAERRSRVSTRLTPVVLLALVAVLGAVVLVAGSQSSAAFDAVVLGMLLGVSAMLLVELAAVPERLRSPSLR